MGSSERLSLVFRVRGRPDARLAPLELADASPKLAKAEGLIDEPCPECAGTRLSEAEAAAETLRHTVETLSAHLEGRLAFHFKVRWLARLE